MMSGLRHIVIALAAASLAACAPGAQGTGLVPDIPFFAPAEPAAPAPKAKPKPKTRFNLLGAELGADCPEPETELASYTTCSDGTITAVKIAIPTFTDNAKALVFDRAVNRFGTPLEDISGGVPMVTKVTLPEVAFEKWFIDDAEQSNRRAMFWWVDETTQHYISVNEFEQQVVISMMKQSPDARQKMAFEQAEQGRLEKLGAQLTSRF